VSLIEQAAKRLEELRRAGADSSSGPTAPVDTPDLEHLPTPEAAVRGITAGRPSVFVSPAPGEGAGALPGVQAGGAAQPKLEIDLGMLKNRCFVTPDAPRSLLADEFRVVKRPVMRKATGPGRVRNGNLVMVTSALSGEGKTFTSINLAMSLAMEIEKSVVLVDGDVAHPDLPNLLGVRKQPGLLDLLTNPRLGFADVLVPTNVDKLAILPAGTPEMRATELLASTQMERMLSDFSTRYPDVVFVFDSPPLLPTTEARELASHMGQIVLVVAADSTHQNAVKLALETIARCEVVHMLLNKADKTEVGSYYGNYGYDRPRE
jgi:exopolysaccharide/PEP-CTERM locus tyrosine autokinase